MALKNILICRTDRIGDVLLSTPVAGILRKKFPGAFISFLTSRYASAVLAGNDDINEILYIDDEGLHDKLEKRKFDAALVLFPEYEVCKKVFKAKIPLRIGPANKWFVPFLLNKPVFQRRSRVEKHEADYNVELLKPLGIINETAETKYIVSGESKKNAVLWKKNNKISEDDKFVIIHPGMKGSALNWPLENYAGLAQRLIKEKGAKLLISYGPGEEAVVKDIKGMMSEMPLVLDRPLELSYMAGLISEADALICPSTGILHLAAAVGTRTVSVFSPILVQSRKRWGPYGKGHVVFEPEVKCGEKFKCKKNRCLYYNCMGKITVDNVYDKISEILK